MRSDRAVERRPPGAPDLAAVAEAARELAGTVGAFAAVVHARCEQHAVNVETRTTMIRANAEHVERIAHALRHARGEPG